MSDANGYEKPQYVTAVGNSHPNGAGTDYIAPQFVNEIFTASIVYESHYNGIEKPELHDPVTCFPNPFHNLVNFIIRPDRAGEIKIYLYNALGREISKSTEIAVPGKEIIQSAGIEARLESHHPPGA